MKTLHHVKHSQLDAVLRRENAKPMLAASVRRDDAAVNRNLTDEAEARRLDQQVPTDHLHRLRY